MTYNVHLLTHIAASVKRLGPIWVHNCFPFEATNRYLLQLSNCPSNVGMDICRKFLIHSSLPLLRRKLVHSPETVEFLQKRLEYAVRGYEDSILVGKDKTCSIHFEGENYLAEHTVQKEDCIMFQKLIFKRLRLVTHEVNDNKKNYNSCIFLSSGACAIIKNICLPNRKVMILAEMVILCKAKMKFQQIKRVDFFGDICKIELKDIIGQGILMKAEDCYYVVEIPYGSIIND